MLGKLEVGIFAHPRLEHLAAVLERSQLGAHIVEQLEHLPTRVLILDTPRGAPELVQRSYAKRAPWMLYHHSINTLVMPETHLHPEGLQMGRRALVGISPEQAAVTLGHEGWHRIQHGGSTAWWKDAVAKEPVRAVTAAVQAARGPGAGSRIARAHEALKGAALAHEIEANRVEAILSRDLGVPNRFLRVDGSVMEDAEIYQVMDTPYYRRLALQSEVKWAGQGLAMAALGAGLLL